MSNPSTPKADALPATFSAYFNAIRENVEELRRVILHQIQDYATADRDTDWLVTCTNDLKAVEQQIDALASGETVLVQVAERIGGFEPGRERKTERGLRSITVEVTEGMVNQSLLSLTVARKRRILSLGERLKITLPDGTTFETEIVEPGNRLRERGLVRAFYQKENIGPGDEVVLDEVVSGEWTLQKAAVELDQSILAELGLGPDDKNGEGESGKEGAAK